MPLPQATTARARARKRQICLIIPAKEEFPARHIVYGLKIRAARTVEAEDESPAQSEPCAAADAASPLVESAGPGIAGIDEEGPAEGAQIDIAEGQADALVVESDVLVDAQTPLGRTQ